MNNNVEIESLHIYPIKSCKGIDLEQASLSSTGFEWDRRWVLVGEDNVFISQRDAGAEKLAVVKTSLLNSTLMIEAPGKDEIFISLEEQAAAPEIELKIHDKITYGAKESIVANVWFSEYLNRPVTLVRMNLEKGRVADPFFAGSEKINISGQDDFPYLVTNVESLNALNRWMHELKLPEVGMQRFRPNIVVSGLDAFEEDKVDQLTFPDGTELRLVKPCARCKIIGVDQDSGEYQGKKTPIIALGKHRNFKNAKGEKGSMFGQNALVDNPMPNSYAKRGETLSVSFKPEQQELVNEQNG